MNVLRKLKLTDTNTATEQEALPVWKDDPDYLRWTAKFGEITQQLRETESQQQQTQEAIQEAEKAVVKIRSELILEEGNQEDMKAAEVNLATLLQKDDSLTLELKALRLAKDRAVREAGEAEAAAKEKAKAIILPLYQERVAATLANLEAVIESNQAVQDFEKAVSQSGLTLYHGIMGSPYYIASLNIPLGMKEYRQAVQGLLSKVKL